MNSDFDSAEFNRDILKRAKNGSIKDAQAALVSAVIALNQVSYASPYLLYLQDCLERIIDGHDPVQVLNVADKKPPGVKARASSQELMAVDIYLRRCLGFPPEKSNARVLELFNLADRRHIQRLRKEYDGEYSDFDVKLMETQSADDLLAEMSVSMRSKVSAIEPHTM